MDVNFATATADVLVVVEAFPKRKQTSRARLCTNVDKDDHFRVQLSSKCIEEPSMRVDFFRVLLLEAENELNWNQLMTTG